jgi:hypothetical protein
MRTGGANPPRSALVVVLRFADGLAIDLVSGDGVVSRMSSRS